MKKMQPSISHRALAIGLASAPLAILPHAQAANPADWRPFTTTGTLAWSDINSWTPGTGIPTSGTSLVINFEPAAAGTTTSGGGISTNFTANNDLGTVQVNTLNFSGSSNGSSRTISLIGGTLQFGGANATINNTTSGASAVNYTVTNNILLDGDLSLNMAGTGATTLVSGTSSTLSANTAGLKTITVTGAGTTNLGGSATSVISDGVGQVGVTMAGSGVLNMGGANTFTGDVLIKSGTVSLNGSSAGTATAFGTGVIKIGDTTGSATATLTMNKNVTLANALTVQNNNGSNVYENTGNNASQVFGGLTTLNDDLTVKYATGGAGNVTFGTSASAAWLTGSGSLTFENNGSGNMTITGSNAGFTGGILIRSGTMRVTSANALSSSNVVAVDSLGGATFNISQNNQTIAGLNNGANGGGLVTNSGAARTLTLAGSGTYTFGGTISAATPANMALTVNLGANGKQILTGNSTYTGVTTITAGTLLVNGNNSAATGAVSVNGGTLGGTGTVGGNTTVANNATLAPGASAGKLTFSGNLTFAGTDSKSNFEIATGARGINYDAVDVGGLLTYNGDLTFTMTGLIANGTYNLYDFTSQTGSMDSIVFGGVGNPYSGAFTNAAGVWTATSGSQTFTFTQSTGDLTVVPEPGTSLLAGMGLALALYTTRRRKA